MRTETINNSKNYWSNKEEPSSKKPKVAETTSTVEIISISDSQSTDSDVGAGKNVSTSQESYCFRISSSYPHTSTFSDSNPSTHTNVDSTDCESGQKMRVQGESTMKVVPISIPVSRSSDSNTSASQEPDCSRSSFTDPSSNSRNTGFKTGYQMPVHDENDAIPDEITADDVMVTLGSLYEELQTESPEMSAELEALNKIVAGNVPVVY